MGIANRIIGMKLSLSGSRLLISASAVNAPSMGRADKVSGTDCQQDRQSVPVDRTEDAPCPMTRHALATGLVKGSLIW